MLKTVVQDSLDLGVYNELYDILIEKDNFWRQLNEVCVWDMKEDIESVRSTLVKYSS